MNLTQSLYRDESARITDGYSFETTIAELAEGISKWLARQGHRTTKSVCLWTMPNAHIIESECSEAEMEAAVEEYLQALMKADPVEGLLPPAGVHTDETGEVGFFYNAPEPGTLEHEIISRWIKQAHAKLQAA